MSLQGVRCWAGDPARAEAALLLPSEHPQWWAQTPEWGRPVGVRGAQ